MAQALLVPLLETKKYLPHEVLGVVGNKHSVKKAIEQLPDGICVVSSDNPTSDQVWMSPIQLLAVKPQQLTLIKKNIDQKQILFKSTI